MKTKLLTLFVSFWITTIACAQSSALNSLDQLLSSWKTLSADFTQQVINGKGQGASIYKGQLYVSKPNRFRWVITEPEPQTIVADGKNLWIYDEELSQVTVQPLSEQLSETPALFLSGEFGKISQAFHIQAIEGAQKKFLVTPKKEDHLLQNMTFTFNQKNQLTHMQIKDVLGQTTELTFSDVKMNPSLSKDLFIFKAPKGVDVVGEPIR